MRQYRFDNGYGASLARHDFSYGGREGLWEVAVIKFYGDGDDSQLCYETPITNDVLGWLNDDKVAETLDAIEALPRAW